MSTFKIITDIIMISCVSIVCLIGTSYLIIESYKFIKGK